MSTINIGQCWTNWKFYQPSIHDKPGLVMDTKDLTKSLNFVNFESVNNFRQQTSKMRRNETDYRLPVDKKVRRVLESQEVWKSPIL